MAHAKEEGRKQDTCSSLHIAHCPFWKDGCPADSCILQAPMGGIPGWKVLFLICAILRLLKGGKIKEDNKEDSLFSTLVESFLFHSSSCHILLKVTEKVRV